MVMWIVRALLFRRFGGRLLGSRVFIALGVLNFLRRRLSRRKPPGVYQPGLEPEVRVYQPSQGSSQTVQRRPR